MRTAVVIAAGSPPDETLFRSLPPASVIVAVDGGLAEARQARLEPDHIVGDLDSCSEDDLAWGRSVGAEVRHFDTDKDATDLELALALVDDLGLDRLIVLGVDGGRVDHELGNWAVLANPDRTASVEVWTQRGTVHVVHSSIELRGAVGDVVSLVPFGGDATGVTTTGLRWKLDAADLSVFASRGISNELLGDRATVTLSSGVLLVVQPAASALNGSGVPAT